MDNHSLYSNKVLSKLVEKGYLKSQGVGKGTKYLLGDVFEYSDRPDNEMPNDKTIDNEDKDKELSIDENKVISYIRENGLITNRLSRDYLGFGKTKYLGIF